jgi:hypothetical protein
MRVLLEMRVLCGYFDPNTCICGSTRIYAGMLGTLLQLCYSAVQCTALHCTAAHRTWCKWSSSWRWRRPGPCRLPPRTCRNQGGQDYHKRLLLVSCSVSVVVIQSSTPCQQTFPCCTAHLVWLVLGAREISLRRLPSGLLYGKFFQTTLNTFNGLHDTFSWGLQKSITSSALHCSDQIQWSGQPAIAM